MKKHLFIIVLGILVSSCIMTNERETRNLEGFDTVNLVGNVELHLEKNTGHSMEIMAQNSADLADLVTEVRNGALYIYYEKECDICETPKYIIYLNHSGISEVSLTGKIKLISDNGISENDLVIRGDGIVNGNLAVDVNTLSVDLKGITNITISGSAETADLKLTGIGMINAGRLKTTSGQNASKGIALIMK